MAKKVLAFTLNVVPRTKKNSMQLIRAKGRMIPIPSKLYREYETECGKCITKDMQLEIDYPINLKATFYVQRNARIDLVNLQEALCDMLVKHKVLADDSALKPSVVVSMDGSSVVYDKNNPRIDVCIERL